MDFSSALTQVYSAPLNVNPLSLTTAVSANADSRDCTSSNDGYKMNIDSDRNYIIMFCKKKVRQSLILLHSYGNYLQSMNATTLQKEL